MINRFSYSAIAAVFVTISLLSLRIPNAHALDFSYDTLSPADFTAGATAISRTVSGITVTATGYSAAAAIGGASDTVTGPLAAFDIHDCTNLNPAICPDGRANGLRLSPAGLGIRDDFTRAIGLNGYLNPAGEQTIDFIVFEFSEAVDIGSVIVDDLSNNGRSIWYVSTANTLDFSQGLASALAGLSVNNSNDDATDGLFTHPINQQSITTLVVGARFPNNTYAGITPSSVNFYVTGLGEVTPANIGESVTVPIPVFAAFILFAITAVISLLSLGRSKITQMLG